MSALQSLNFAIFTNKTLLLLACLLLAEQLYSVRIFFKFKKGQRDPFLLIVHH